MVTGLIGCGLFSGIGFDFWFYRRRRILGAAISLCGIVWGAYAMFWPLLPGGW
jgi:hypothetical protein